MTVKSLTCNLEAVKAQVGQEGACLKEVEQEITVLIHPKYTANQLTGVKRELDAMSRRHSKELGGMVVAYDRVRLLSPHGWMFDGNPFIHMRVAAWFYVFCPAPGDLLKGVVHKKSTHHLGCLAHGSYNISVPRPNSEPVDFWAGTLAGEGDPLTLTVLFASLTNYHMPYIRAAIHPDSVKELKERQTAAATAGPNDDEKKTGNAPNQRTVFYDDSGISSNEAEENASRKRKRSEEEEEEEEEKTKEVKAKRRKTVKEEEEEEEGGRGKKRKRKEEKKKRKRDSIVDMEGRPLKEEEEEVEEEDTCPSKKRRKRKRKEEADVVRIKIEKVTIDEEQEERKRKEEEEEERMSIKIKQERIEEQEGIPPQTPKAKKKKKKVKSKSIKEERESVDESATENGMSDLPVPLFKIKRENCSTLERRKKVLVVKKEIG